MPIGIYVMEIDENLREQTIDRLIDSLRRARLAQGLSLNQAAKRADLDQTMVGRVEKRTRQPTIDTLLKLSDALGADFPTLLREAITPTEPPTQRIASSTGQAAPAPSPRRTAVKMTDLARHLGLSRLTVSAVLNNRHDDLRISAKTVQRVRDAAAQLGYVRNQLAIATKTGRTSSIGIIVSDFSAAWVSRTLRGFLNYAKTHHHTVVIEEVSGQASEERALTKFMEQRVGGIFCCNFNPDGDLPEILAETSVRYGCPVASCISSHSLPGLHIDSDDRDGMAQAAGHVWSLGHRRIACLGIDSDPLRTRHIVEAARQLGGDIPEAWQVIRRTDNQQLEADTFTLLTKGGTIPTALLCATDELAAIATRAAYRAGLTIPDDLSIVGFSNDKLGLLLPTRLTTVAQPFEELGKRAAERLHGEMLTVGEPTESINAIRRELLPVKLVVRESTAKPRAARR